MILGIEASSSLCSLCFWENGRSLAYQGIEMRTGQASLLFDLLEKLQTESGISLHQVSHVAVTRGPGSFTGIRVGLSMAKGFGLAGKLPVLGLTNFEVALHKIGFPPLVGLAFDTKRRDFYGAFYKNQECMAMGVWEPSSLLEKAKEFGVLNLWVDGVLENRASTSILPLSLTAKDVASAAESLLLSGSGVFSSDPFYLRPPKVYEDLLTS